MENFSSRKNSTTSRHTLYRSWYERFGIDYAAALYEQICLTQHRCYNSIRTIWYFVVISFHSNTWTLGQNISRICYVDFRNLGICVVHTAYSI